ncbi:MAG: nucleoside hydrolase, partial [Candidatus Kryptoniota bacterium]
DPIAAAAALHPEWFKWRPTKVVIETQGKYTGGMTISDFRTFKERHSNVLVATNFSWKLFLKDFLLKVFGSEIPDGKYKTFLHRRFVPEFFN